MLLRLLRGPRLKLNVYLVFSICVFLLLNLFLFKYSSGGEDSQYEDVHLNADPSVYKKRWEAFSQNTEIVAPQQVQNDGVDSKQPKYVIMHDARVGYGNRMYTFMNTVAVAVLTNSKAIINWQFVDKYISLNSKKFVFNLPAMQFINKNNTARVFKFPFEVDNSWRTQKDAKTLYQELPLDYDVYHVIGYGPVFFELLTNQKFYDRLVEAGYVSRRTIENAKSAKNEKDNSAKIEKLYQVGFEFANFVLKNIWLPNSALQRKINEFSHEHFRGSYVIGIQIRFEYTSGDEDLERLIACAYLLESVFQEKQLNSKKLVKWFLSTDSEHLSETLKAKYEDKVITAEGNIGHVMYGGGFERAILDNELLSLCNDLIITGGSTFGFVSAMRMGSMPLFFNGRRNSKTCERMSFNKYPTRPEGYAVI